MNPSSWRAVIRVCEADLQLLVLDVEGDRLKARLPLCCAHPRALVTVLEGLAMWQGGKLDVVHFVDARATDCTDWAFSNADLRGNHSPLVAFSTRVHGRVKDRIRGVGDFRQLRLLGGDL
jgi:hypothetical protein